MKMDKEYEEQVKQMKAMRTPGDLKLGDTVIILHKPEYRDYQISVAKIEHLKEHPRLPGRYSLEAVDILNSNTSGRFDFNFTKEDKFPLVIPTAYPVYLVERNTFDETYRPLVEEEAEADKRKEISFNLSNAFYDYRDSNSGSANEVKKLTTWLKDHTKKRGC